MDIFPMEMFKYHTGVQGHIMKYCKSDFLCGACWRGLISIEEYRPYHQDSPDRELQGETEVEDEDAGDAGDDDGKTAGEALEDVVCVLHHDGHQEAAKSVLCDGEPDKGVVAVEEAMFRDL